MARNHNNDKEGGIIKRSVELESNDSLTKRQRWLVSSLLGIAIITIISFLIPDEYYTHNVNILFLNVELLIIFARDIYLYFKNSCKAIRAVLILMVATYVLNIIDLLYNIPHLDYMTILCMSIVAALSIIFLSGYKK